MERMGASDGPLFQRSRAWYEASLEDFFGADSETILGHLAINGDFSLLTTQRDAWRTQIDILKAELEGVSGSLFFEFNIPRMGRRIDVVLLVRSVVFVIEFKVGGKLFERSAIDQVWDYALDLKNFHHASHDLSIIPVLIATEASELTISAPDWSQDRVSRPIAIAQGNLRNLVDSVIHSLENKVIDGQFWSASAYQPTPTIVEAARSLYAQHSVEAIVRNDAGAKNLAITSAHVEEIVNKAKRDGEKVICFVTGVPGAGKTLVGLNLATSRKESLHHEHAVFLSGNGPLVAVLREALTRDEVSRCRDRGEKISKKIAEQIVKPFIQNVHHFRDEALVNAGAPAEHVVIFDEAQRAWNLHQTASFMKRKRGHGAFDQSEPEFLISCMDRHDDWAVVVCLVGGGQEINTGEAGIGSWIQAVHESFPHWKMHISSGLTDSEYAAGEVVELVRKRTNTSFDDCLHLSASMRSFRADNVSHFVKTLLDCEPELARDALSKLSGRYPLMLTRDLEVAKKWIRKNARGTERYGIVASSGAQRLKPHAIDVRVDVDPVHWFLGEKSDPRSSYYMEDAATEFQVQGLELDWVCVTWDGNLRFAGSGWSFHNFRGDRWQKVNKPDDQTYLKNAYRVLLTRARQGMVIFVPYGNEEDPTRSPEYYDATFNYMAFDLGVPLLS